MQQGVVWIAAEHLGFAANQIKIQNWQNVIERQSSGRRENSAYVLIAEGNIDKHVIAIAAAILDSLKKMGIHPYSTEGMKNGDWIVIDCLDIMVHLFMPGFRDKYQLEELWRAGKIIDVQIDVSPKF